MKRWLTLLATVILLACNQQQNDKTATLSRNGVTIAYRDCGKGDTTLLFIHGWCINKEYWEPQFNTFCNHYRIVAVDLPGFGHSGKNRTDWNFDEYTADIKYVIEQLALKNVILIGHSMSGDIILNADNQYPQLLAGIVGIDNLHQPGGPQSIEQQKNNDEFFYTMSLGFDSTVNKYMRQSLFQPTTDSSIVNRVMNNVFGADSLIATAVLRSLTVIWQKEKILMNGLSHKLYLVNSDVMPVMNDSLGKYCSKGFHTELVPATGHYPMIEKPELFNIALQKVLNEISH